METLKGVEIVAFRDVAGWEHWLTEHWDRPTGAWLRIAKKGTGVASITAAEALEGALCFGWIDSQSRGEDETFYLQKYSPRRPGGSWSLINVDKIERLIAAGRMREPGLSEVRAAQADGRWEAAYASQATATVPPDLERALDADAGARAVFDALGKSARYALILPILKARTPKTRAARLAAALTTLTEHG